jgi:hypothetical protein
LKQVINTRKRKVVIRVGKLPENEKKYLLSLKPEDITFDLLVDLFGDKSKVEKGKVKVVPSRIKTSDEFVLEKGEYINSERVTTNAGLFIYNKLIVERELKDVLGYVNVTINSGQLGAIEDKLSKALLNDDIAVEAMSSYLNRTQWLSMQFHSVISGSFTMGTLKPLPGVMKQRNQMLKDNREKLDKGDVVAAAKIEKDLLKVAEEELKHDHGLDLYKSGARGSFGNNFKTISVMKGPVFNPSTGEFDIIESNFMEGIRKEDIPSFGNSVVTGAYPKAIGTATSGYFSKQIIAALQAVQLDKKGSDCGTKGYLKTTIQPSSTKDFLYRYIMDGGKLVLLTDKNIGGYVGKEVKMRSPMYCTGKKKCRVCAGLMYEKLNIQNVGLTASRVSSTLLNLSMKKFHDTSAKVSAIKPDNMVL